eukprot:TRINITY_DN11233_c0_g2_i1.p1 TRINITY_DN11233_c0_g2~~TRINITY_DN11233_c0_g2_i1.p1  ORF type:complete len:151 (-),score=8.24 TRINITY_DN11233_c0_g2_i1:118-570(-)
MCIRDRNWDTHSGLNWNIRIYPDTKPPVAVEGFRGESISTSEIKLQWDPNKEKDLAGYHVFRDGKRINRTMLNTLEFVDGSQIEEGTYYSYTIVAVDKTGNESVVSKVDVLSARDEITVPIFDFTASIRSRRPIKLIATTDVSYLSLIHI